jgi:hypothetical protein
MTSKITLAVAIALAAIVATPSGNSALAAKHKQKTDTTVQKTDEAPTNPYAPGQQRFRSTRHKEKPAH